jgi:geranylgeranyl diphosphate synthase type I
MTSPALTRFIGEWLPPIEAEMRSLLDNNEDAVAAHYGMLRYHMGWANVRFDAELAPAGKRLRPIFCLLGCDAVGGNVEMAIPAAAALELLHNFSLVHDDIEDGDEQRRHRATLWKVWGVPQAINAGDGLFALSFAAIQRLEERGLSAEATLAALRVFTQMCVELTEGQHLDMLFEARDDVTVPEYLRMIQGKTGALVGASVAIGAIVGGAEAAQSEALWHFGRAVGLAFQVQDDILGIWGDPAETGKAAGNDVLRRKKSLPMLYTLNDAGVGQRFAALLRADDFGPARLDDALALLDEAGARAYAEAQVQRLHDNALAALQQALGDRADDLPLRTLAESLLNRTR